MTAFVVHCGLVLLVILADLQRYSLMPMILIFLTTIALMTIMRLRFQPRTKSAVR